MEKAVYSLWTSPLGTPETGYNSTLALRESAALSLHYARQHFKRTELITDRQGAKLLEGLPYDNLVICLDEDLTYIPYRHWSFSKLHACKNQTEPFIHLDFDVFLLNALPDDLLQADAAFQNIEDEHCAFAYQNLIAHSTSWDQKPPYVHDTIRAYNCGIMSFNRLDLIPEWYNLAISYIDWFERNPNDNVCTSLYFEQFLLYWLCKHKGYQIKTLEDYKLPFENEPGLDDRTAERLGYTHLMSHAKRNPLCEEAVSNKLKTLNPALWQTVHYV